jgi:tetratricopeptide (TPR) repeat protein
MISYRFYRSSRFVAGALAGLLALGAAPSLIAQQGNMGGMAMGSTSAMDGMQPVPAPEQLPAPVRMTGIGNGHISITASPEAQAWFDQGLNLLHDFWDYESIKAFEQGIRVDPQCAMCWWGIAQAEGFRDGAGKAYGIRAVAEAVRLKGHTKGAEKLYIEAAQAASVAKKGDETQEIAILRKLVKKYPQDLQGRIFLAIAVEDGYDDAGEPKPGEKEGITLLEGVLRDAPNDSAANHYWIHAMEPGNHPERALQSATLLASLAPTSGHMVHMPGHIFYRVGNYAEAERWFTASTAADERYMREQHVGPDDDWNYVHNMMYGIADLMEQGKLAEANALSDRLAGARGQLSATLYVWSARDQMARLSRRLPVALRVGDWDGVLAMLDQAPVAEGDKTTNLRFLASELRDFAMGMRALDRDALDAAQGASARMDAGLWRLQQEQADAASAAAKAKADPSGKAAEKKDEPPMVPIMPDADSGPLVHSLSVASLELRAGVLAGQGKLEAAKKLFATAAKDEKSLGYHEPPLYIRPVGETEAVALLRARDYAGAKAAYEAALVERPDSGFELYGLAHVMELSGDAKGARAGYQAFLKAWPAADGELPEMTHARKVLSGGVVASR